MRRITHLLVLAAFIFSCGGQWYALQCVAWVKMIHDYSQIVPFTEAVGMTFSGKYPCAICKALADKEQSENTKTCSIEKYEKIFLPSVASNLVGPIGSPLQHTDNPSSFWVRAETPPTPPPRQALS